MGRPSCQSSLLSDPNANFSLEMSRTSNIKEGRHVGLDFYDLLIEDTTEFTRIYSLLLPSALSVPLPFSSGLLLKLFA
jgi:hypothetical protein